MPKLSAEGANIRQQSRAHCQRVEDNAFHLEARTHPIQNRDRDLSRIPTAIASHRAAWVEPGALFHIRIAVDREKEQKPLTDPALAQAILDSVRFYETKMRWHVTLFLLMPDHLHALLSFARDESMSEVIKDWKRFHTRINQIVWQEGYFDHRLRNDGRGEQLSTKMTTFGKIQWLPVCARKPNTGRG